jgi:terminase small subunit / prophage DNA-packing protein
MVLKDTATAAELGVLLGISTRAVRDHAQRGVIPKTPRGRYRLLDAVPAYCSHMRNLLASRGGEATVLSGTAERARLAMEQADSIALKNAVARGALLDAAATEREWTSILAGVRAGVLAASSRIGQRLQHLSLSDIAEVDDELRAVLGELGGAP